MTVMAAPIEPHAPSPPPESRRSVREAKRVGILAALLLAQAIFFAPAVRAEPPADRVVQVLNDVCIAPRSPQGMIDAGRKVAAAEGWRLVVAGPAPPPIIHNDAGPKISFESAWQFDFADGSRGGLWVSIMGPDRPDVRHSVCNITADIEPDVLADALEQRLESLIVRDKKKWTGSRKWFFTGEWQQGNCGRWIVLSEQRASSLMYHDGAYPNDGNWNGPLSETACRS